MNKLVLTSVLVIASAVNVFSQKTDFDKFGLNNKVINYILKGDYQKVIDITKTSYFRSISMKDTNWVYGGFFDKQHPISDQDLIGYLSRIREIINASNFDYVMQNPNGITIEVTNWSMIDEHLKGTPRENEMTTYANRTYILKRDNYTIYFILAFQNSKLDGFGFDFRIDKID